MKREMKTVNKIWNRWCDLSSNPEINGVEQCIEFDAWFTKLMRPITKVKANK